MPTYKFCCDQCNLTWEEQQTITQEHISKCSKCGDSCKNIAFGGTGFQFAGRLLNNQLHGFPDHENKINKEGDKEAEKMEKEYDTYTEEALRKEKERKS